MAELGLIRNGLSKISPQLTNYMYFFFAMKCYTVLRGLLYAFEYLL